VTWTLLCAVPGQGTPVANRIVIELNWLGGNWIDPDLAPVFPERLYAIQNRPGSGVAGSQAPNSKNDYNRKGKYYFLNDSDTDKITKVLAGALKTCGPDALERRYRIDCVRYYFWQMSRELPDTGEYLPVKQALAKAATELEAIVKRNRDPSAAPVRPRLKGGSLAPRLPPIHAIRPEAEARAMREAQAVIEETATVLLRSTENSQRRMIHFQQIAAAVGSTKVLLRSS
jgi:hypothetical protein